jgi:hypothetical protein
MYVQREKIKQTDGKYVCGITELTLCRSGGVCVLCCIVRSRCSVVLRAWPFLVLLFVSLFYNDGVVDAVSKARRINYMQYITSDWKEYCLYTVEQVAEYIANFVEKLRRLCN